MTVLSYFTERHLVTMPDLTRPEKASDAVTKLSHLRNLVFRNSHVFTWNGNRRVSVAG